MNVITVLLAMCVHVIVKIVVIKLSKRNFENIVYIIMTMHGYILLWNN